MGISLSNETHRRKTVHKDRASPSVVVSEIVHAEWDGTKPAFWHMIRSPYGVLLLAWTGALAGLFVSERKGDALNLLLLSIPVAVLSIASAVLAYRSARIVTQVELSLQPKVFDLVRLRAHETESAVLLKALEVFGDSERALQWMGESNPALENESPIRAVQTEDGRREVLSILGRIQHGVIS